MREHPAELITWLDEIGDFTIALAGVPASKLRSLAMKATTLDASALRKDTLPEKRYTLIVALLTRAMLKICLRLTSLIRMPQVPLCLLATWRRLSRQHSGRIYWTRYRLEKRTHPCSIRCWAEAIGYY